MTDEEFVKTKHPNVRLEKQSGQYTVVRIVLVEKVIRLSAPCKTKESAWTSAARRIRQTE